MSQPVHSKILVFLVRDEGTQFAEGGEPLPLIFGPMPTVLFVEDNPQIRSFVAEYLRSKGFDVHAVDSGEAAVSMMQIATFDVVISDHRLEGPLSGVDILACHKRHSPEKARILFTAVASEQLRDQCEPMNAVYLQKPVPLDELLENVKTSLGHVASERPCPSS
ncbi:MAG: response regulator [Candidatus Binatia bacterium]